ncbi:uncharacterized protein LOC120426587 [Culex pipiens pallens]|uniref:uncharacterized protein LOC120426587 n=1 Tax=Culex pipiens pallens TaxID=42434 RepID=UPI0019534E42|nr:uncharacterized protein LOC120426587 [Culex pipiens pallens]
MAAVTPPRTSHHHHEPLFYPVDSPPIFGRSPRHQPSFSVPDLDYKMKMMQLTLHFRAASTTGTSHRRSPTGRHSIGSFLRPAEESTPAVSHQPKILAVEPKFRPVNAVKPGRSNPSNVVQVSVKSATLPIVPQQTKVKRLVRLFEESSGTTVVSVKSHAPKATPGRQMQMKALLKVKPDANIVQATVKPVQKVNPEEPPTLVNEIPREVSSKVSPLIQNQKIIMKSPEPAKADSSPVDDDVIKDVLRQRRKVKELCKFFEQQAKY